MQRLGINLAPKKMMCLKFDMVWSLNPAKKTKESTFSCRSKRAEMAAGWGRLLSQTIRGKTYVVYQT